MSNTSHKKTACSHCGDTCPDDQFRTDTQQFCCHGCEMVYNLLHDNGMADYYRLIFLREVFLRLPSIFHRYTVVPVFGY